MYKMVEPGNINPAKAHIIPGFDFGVVPRGHME
jgi:hypothetical protein